MKLTRRQLAGSFAVQGIDPGMAFEKLGLKPPPVGPKRKQGHPEQDVLNAVLAMLRVHPKVAWAARINSGAYKTPDGRFIRFGFAGCSDVIGQMKDGAFLAIETKSEDGRATEEQAAFVDRVRANGGRAGIARSVDDALEIVG